MKATAMSLAVLSCVVFQPEIASAQAAILMIPFCKKIADDGARLKCFDAMVADLMRKDPEEKVKTAPPQWQFDESKSPIDDSPQVIAMLDSDDGGSSLVIRCMEKRTEVAFAHKNLFVFEKSAVLVRLNDMQPASYTWTASNNNKALFAPSPMTLAKNLPDNGKLFIRATGRSQSVDGTFQLGDMTAVRERVGTACQWNAAEASAAPAVPAQTQKAAPAKPVGPVPYLPTR